ncbi:methionine ABC transporter ATP-binding protein [Peribacillus sp. V2I11]|uniref:methionine ABC transporter ATP-binding protein n=1 Tax=Peribacillus sp. V2I11 TaxID=3042277 RepID=UPI002789FDED|nr:methionine ABC transporter ATP-binding protein [Peribacillus sp. V2I11]MDQ0882299.1 D-methionine transport system ATP-binding protein [Peribacillus sp. V2I11]
MIEFQNVKKVYQTKKQTVEALKGINLTVEKGDIFGVVGYSGAGKSTLIRLVNLLEHPSDGQVIVGGKDLTKLNPKELRAEKKKIGMIFQHFNLLNSKTVFDNIAMPLILSGTPAKEIKKRVAELLEFVGLSSKAKSYPEQLSGGQKQRIGIARALATNPSILLCDEATSALDPQTTSAVLQLLKKINKEYNITILLITHEMSVIREICNKVAVMEGGCVVEQGSVFEVFAKPQTDIAKNFVRTVIHDEIPQSFLKGIGSHIPIIWKINFIGTTSGTPLLSTISKKYDVHLSVLSANISEIQETPFGNLIIEVTGNKNEVDKAYQYIKDEGILVQEVQING